MDYNLWFGQPCYSCEKIGVQRIMINRLILLFIVGISFLMSDCVFDTGGVPAPFHSNFKGCFSDASELGGITLNLSQNNDRDLLSGTLVVEQGSQQKVYALTGRNDEGSSTTAICAATETTDPNARNKIVIIYRENDDKVTLQINDGPPSKPLSRCP